MTEVLPDDYNILLTDSGLRALQIVDGEKIDLMVCEYDLPEISGQELVKMIRSRYDENILPMIIYTNEPRQNWDKESKNCCQFSFMKYDTDVEQLAETIRKILE